MMMITEESRQEGPHVSHLLETLGSHTRSWGKMITLYLMIRYSLWRIVILRSDQIKSHCQNK